jgi:LysR family transcriptional regulator, glycine cleavage system transcriptional activator
VPFPFESCWRHQRSHAVLDPDRRDPLANFGRWRLRANAYDDFLDPSEIVQCVVEHRGIEHPHVAAHYPASSEFSDSIDGGALQHRIGFRQIHDVADDVVAHEGKVCRRHIDAEVIHRLAGIEQEVQLVPAPAQGDVVEDEVRFPIERGHGMVLRKERMAVMWMGHDQCIGKQSKPGHVVAHEVGGGGQGNAQSPLVAEHAAQPTRVLFAAQRVDQEYFFSIDERGSHGFVGISHEHHYVSTQFFDSHDGSHCQDVGIVGIRGRGDKRVVLGFALQKLMRYDRWTRVDGILVKRRHAAPLNALRTFEAAARHLSFGVAAQELFVTPAAVSHQIKHLEAYLGTPLFQRSHRSVVLTQEGQALADTVGELLGQLDVALDRAMSGASTDLRVTTMESLAAKWLAPRLHRFQRARPDIRVRVVTGDRHVDFVKEGFDVGIRYGSGGYAGVHYEALMDAHAFPVCAPSLLADDASPLAHPQDLRHHTLLHDESARGRPGVPSWSDWLRVAGANDVDARPGPVFASIYLAQEAAIAGHGVAMGIGPLVQEDLRQGRLVRPFEPVAENAYRFWLVRQAGRREKANVDAFCQWLQEEASSTTTGQA